MTFIGGAPFPCGDELPEAVTTSLVELDNDTEYQTRIIISMKWRRLLHGT
jgi:hypothetical protein